NLAVRQAITMATDRTLIVEDILRNLAEEADSLIPTATPDWHYYVPDEEKFHFDIEAANELLNESGYHQFDDSDFGFAGVRENETSGARLEFDFYYIRATTRDQLTAGKMALWCEDIGVKLNLIDESEGKLYEVWFNLQYDMFIWNWQPDVDPTFLLSVLTTNQIPENSNDYTAWSDAFYSNPEYDQLFEDQKNAMDFEERQTIVYEMQRIAYRDCPYICLWYPFSLIAYRTDAFMNFPDMERYVGTTPDSIWLYFEILPFDDAANDPPYDVYAGEDAEVYVGADKTFSGSAKDLDNSQEELTWTWIITEEDVDTTLDGQTITHTFDTICVAEVMLSVSDPEGLSSSDSLTVTVLVPPTNAGPDIGEVTPVPLTGFIGEEVTWTAQAMDAEQGDDGAGLLFTWDWGDGSPNTVELMCPVENDTFALNEQTHTWSAEGSYEVTVSVWDGYGVETDMSHNVSVPYDYEVSTNAAPDGPDVSPIDGIEGVEVSCVATAVDPDPDVLIFTWDWGDGTYAVTTHDTSSAPGTPVTSVVDYTWSTAGTHAVTVYVDDGEAGHNMSADVDAVIVAAGEEAPPSSISLGVTPYPRYVDEELTLNISAYDANGDALIVTVEFGDDSGTASQTTAGGTVLQYAEFVHTYTSEGTFTVTMYVDDGTTNVTETDDLEIIPPMANRPPVVTLQSTYTFSLGVEREIRPSKAMDPDGDDFSVWYDWGDDTSLTPGDPDDSFAASHTYDSVGTYDLIVWADDGVDNDSAAEALVIVPSGLGWITGYVWDAAGEPIEGALVSINGTNTHENVDVLGLYNISVVPGTYEVVASADGHSNETADVSIEMDVGSWSNFTLVTTSGSVTGQVLDSATDIPVAHALVELYQTGEENASYEKETDENGSFEIVLVDEGTYEVVVSRNGYETNDTVDVTVTSGDTASLTIYLTAEEDVGLSTTAIAAIAALAIIAAVAAAALLLKRKKGSEPELPEDEPAPEQRAEPPEPPET
ncbi:MAG: PKD domain-containing protein, partial [Thermoplasmata archaeon]|nr:PKD domain-containing protein [Thermoplasmata archaeon]